MGLREYAAQQAQEKQETLETQQAQSESRDNNMIKLSNDNERLKRQQSALNRFSGEVKADLLKGLDAGKDITDLFLLACKGIADVTQEKLFYETICRKLEERGIGPKG